MGVAPDPLLEPEPETNWTGSNPLALILGEGDTALAVLRLLAEAGIGCWLLSTAAGDHARLSRFGDRCCRVPSPDGRADELLETLEALPEACRDGVLIPTTDAALLFVARHLELLTTRFRPAAAAGDAVETLVDKDRLYRKAGEIGIACPAIARPASHLELEALQPKLAFPCLLKPSTSQAFQRVFGTKLLLAESWPELRGGFDRAVRHGLEVFVSEHIPGPATNLFHYRCYLDRHGRVAAEICTQKLRQYPRDFGVASFSRTVAMIPELRDRTLLLLNSLGFWGAASAEYKHDPRTGDFVLIEVNARVSLPERLFAAAGVNFPATVFRDLAGFEPVAGEYRPGVFWFHPLYDALRVAYRRDLSLRDAVEPYRRRAVAAVSLLDDPAPCVGACWQMLREAARSRFQRGRV